MLRRPILSTSQRRSLAEAVAADRLTAPDQPILLVDMRIAHGDMPAQQSRLRQQECDQPGLADARLTADADESTFWQLDVQRLPARMVSHEQGRPGTAHVSALLELGQERAVRGGAERLRQRWRGLGWLRRPALDADGLVQAGQLRELAAFGAEVLDLVMPRQVALSQLHTALPYVADVSRALVLQSHDRSDIGLGVELAAQHKHDPNQAERQEQRDDEQRTPDKIATCLDECGERITERGGDRPEQEQQGAFGALTRHGSYRSFARYCAARSSAHPRSLPVLPISN
jgi:hypothetical protein